MLSALAVSVMFVSCSKDDVVKDTKAEFVKEQAEKNAGYKAKVDSKDEISTESKKDFNNWLADWGKALKEDAAKGKAGIMKYQNGGKDAYRVFNEKGFEYEQLIKKGLIGAYQLSGAIAEGKKAMVPTANKQEILNKVATYLIGGPENINNEKVDMESHGKKFKGYKVLPEDNEFAKYLNVVSNDPDFATLSDDLYKAFRKAKESVGTNKFIYDLLEVTDIAQKVVAIRGVHYLAAGSDKLSGDLNAGAAHAISEGLGFVYSLQFAYNSETHNQPKYYTKEDVDAFLGSLDLWNADEAKTKLQEKAEEIADKFGFTVPQAKDAEK